MTFQEAMENECTIFVANAIIAEQLKKKYGYHKIKSIKSICIDGLRRVYIDKNIKWMTEVERIESSIKPFGVIYGDIPPG
ncbi:hypothetical protein B1B04_24390 [Lysinibacillus sp. KCTC 33748]|uniref:hypothetical protein n=1 Tax=unclassified Lysinibacillus TaxID=2636778 RepID=UPI0009A8BE73|nr:MULTISPECIES: hypothetical protein [unclassified Lysinibacillus]OXS66087.1 hypothetical protein B1B04_24390 [Lysinibacillus sp. KCTC 33748]SKC18424.1 hypothetical protein SAMN06295926_13719 [Lysinibacillus sp. AC-3]